MKIRPKIYIQASAASMLLCGFMTLFAFASDTVAIADEPLPTASSKTPPQSDVRGEAPLNFPEAAPIFSASEESSSANSSSAEHASEALASEEASLSQDSVSQNDPSQGTFPLDNSSQCMPSEGPSSLEASSSASSQGDGSAFPASSEPSGSVSQPPVSSSSSPAPASSLPASSSAPASSSSAVSSSDASSSLPSTTPAGSETLRMLVGGTAQDIDAYTALCQVVEAEMGGSYHTEALKAQAVAAYSYIRYENARGAAASLPMRTPTQKTKDAVSAVMGEAVYSGGSIAFTPYHASSAGWTNPSQEVWSGSYSYLTRVESPYDPSSANKDVKALFSASKVQSGLERLLGVTLDPDDPGSWLQVSAVSDSGYVLTVTVTDQGGQHHTITGRQMRESVLSYGIRSHAFTVSWDGGQFVFVTNGYGHGVGMSQTGAEGYAQNGWTYRQILSHYYPGTTVK